MEFKTFGKYVILKKIASGGMAEIFLATGTNNTGLSRFFVIKRILSQFSANQDLQDMFKNEGKVACNLKHKNIVPMYEFDIEQNQPYLSMEYIAGKNIREFIKKLSALKKTVDICHSVYIIKEAASGLSHAHHAIDSSTGQPLNLIHRDVSPQNIMMSYDGEIRLIDFGISKITGTDLTRAGHLKGKFSYMSPEQARGETLDTRTDIFCIGIILWELLSGKRLFRSKNELDALKKIKHCDIPHIKTLNPTVPDVLADIVHKALNKNRNLRHGTAAELAKDLSVFLNMTYPEFSQYNFISFVKAIYSKEIMEEREMLKSYSQKFKSHMEFLNSNDDSLLSQTLTSNLDIPNVDTEMNDIKAHSLITDNKDSFLTSKKNQEHLSVEKDNEKTKILTKTESRIQTDLETATEVATSSKELSDLSLMDEKKLELKQEINQTIKNPKPITNIATATSKKDDPKIPDSSLANNTKPKNGMFDIVIEKDSNKSLLENYKNLQTRSVKKTRSQSGNVILTRDTEQDAYFKKQILSFIGLIAIVFFAFLSYKYKEKIIYSNSVDKIFNKSESNTVPVLKTPLEKQVVASIPTSKKIWIRTSPSGANIYINNKMAGITPMHTNINLNEPVEFTFSKKNYKSVIVRKDTGSQLSNSLDLTLEKIRIRQPASKVTIINE